MSATNAMQDNSEAETQALTDGFHLVIDALKLTFRKVKLNKSSDCICNDKK